MKFLIFKDAVTQSQLTHAHLVHK